MNNIISSNTSGSTSKNILRVAVMADIHTHEALHESLEPVFAEIGVTADVLVICGDLTHIGVPAEARRLARELAVCKIPILAVMGNHDHHSDMGHEVKKILEKQVTFLEDETFTKDHVGFAGTKGFGGGFDNYMLSYFGERPTKEYVNAGVNEALHLENDLRSLTTPKLVVVLHYSPIEATVRGEPREIVPFLGCSRLAETIDRFHVSFVVHGHAHFGTHEGKTSKGIPVYNCAKDLLMREKGKPYVLFEL